MLAGLLSRWAVCPLRSPVWGLEASWDSYPAAERVPMDGDFVQSFDPDDSLAREFYDESGGPAAD